MWAFLWFLSISFFLISLNIYGFGSVDKPSDRSRRMLKISLIALGVTLLANFFTPDQGVIFFTTGLVCLINGFALIVKKHGRIPSRSISKAIGIAAIFFILGLVLTPAAETAATPSKLTKTTEIATSTTTSILTQPTKVTHQTQTFAIQTSAASTLIPAVTDYSTPSTPSSPIVKATSPPISQPATEIKVHFLDVGQGTSTVFEIGDKVMIIDGGDRDKSSFVVAYLKKIGVQKVDVMVSTHYDSDHLNGLVGVLNVFPVENIYDANYATDTRVFSSFKSIIQERNIPEIIPGMRQKIEVGNAVVTFVAPRQYGDRDSNDNSICMRVTYGQTNFLIMGDPSADAEQQILSQDLQADVFLASHHGSDGSNSKTLLAKVNPRYVVLSCGDDNQYGYPGHNTLNRINNIGAQLYRTDIQGTLICTSNGTTIHWDKPPCNDFTPGSQSDVPPSSTAPIQPTSRATTTVLAELSPCDYVLNTNTKKFHYPSCYSASQISPSNRKNILSTRESIIAQGYVPCKNCNP